MENYLDFKVGEVWEEVIAELMVDNIIPIKSDREALQEIQGVISAKSEAVRRHQVRVRTTGEGGGGGKEGRGS